jgi:LysR family transcriptional regulator, hydrogen peroxide-inducible genes activator
MQMHQIRYFLALCEESNFTRAAKRSGVSQPSLTTAIGALERELGSPLFQRKPFVAMTALGCEMEPYMRQIAETADLAFRTAQTFVQISEGRARPSVPLPKAHENWDSAASAHSANTGAH